MRPNLFYRNRRSKYHVPGEKWLDTGKAICGADIGRPAYVAYSEGEILRAGQSACKHCLKLTTNGGEK